LENSKEKKDINGSVSGSEDNDGGKKKEALGNMEKIEKEFTDLKEKFFKDKIGQLKKEVDAIKNGMLLYYTNSTCHTHITFNHYHFAIFCGLSVKPV
jgi:hypothetical protein